MSLVDDIIKKADSFVGYLEKKSNSKLDDFTANAGSNNYTMFARDYKNFTGINIQGQAWCDCFVDTMFCYVVGADIAKKLLGGFSAYTPTSANYFKQMNAWHTANPQKGDIIFFKNSTRICHTGIVYKVERGHVYTIEGNTSAAKGVVANGGGVSKKSYSLTYASIAGYGRPNYAAYEVKKTTIKEYTDNEEILWELNHRGIISDVDLWRNQMSADKDIYWICRKAVQYIRTKSVTETAIKAYTDKEEILWELRHRGIATNIDLWRQKMDDTNVYWLCQKIVHYVRTQKKEI